jgi:hypothetical protein
MQNDLSDKKIVCFKINTKMVHIGTKGHKGRTILCPIGPDDCDKDIGVMCLVIQDITM